MLDATIYICFLGHWLVFKWDMLGCHTPLNINFVVLTKTAFPYSRLHALRLFVFIFSFILMTSEFLIFANSLCVSFVNVLTFSPCLMSYFLHVAQQLALKSFSFGIQSTVNFFFLTILLFQFSTVNNVFPSDGVYCVADV